MGLWPGDHYYGQRYDYAEEYVTILRELWEHGRSDFKGRFYELDDCHLGRAPSRSGSSARASPTGDCASSRRTATTATSSARAAAWRASPR